jgi:secreted trypsin-like serine protease
MKSLWFLFFLSVFAGSSAQLARFIVNIMHYQPPNIGGAEFRCSASLINAQHVLTAASCVSVDPSIGIAIAEVTESSRSRV